MKERPASGLIASASARINHDRTLRGHFGSSDAYCAECLSVFLDPAQETLLRLDRTRLLPPEHIDAAHRERRADLVAQTELKSTAEPVGIVFAVEHKSDRIGFAAVRQLFAQVAAFMARHPDQLVTGGLLCNGPDRRYRGPPSYRDAHPAVRCLSGAQRALLHPHLVDFKPFFVNLHEAQVQQRFAALSPESRATLVALTAPWETRRRPRQALIRRISTALSQIADPHKQISQAWLILRYLVKYWQGCSVDSILELERAAVPPQERIMGLQIEIIDELAADYVDAGIEEGIERGLEQGIEEGIKQGKQMGEKTGEEKAQYAIAERSLARGIDLETVAEITGLSKRDLRHIRGD